MECPFFGTTSTLCVHFCETGFLPWSRWWLRKWRSMSIWRCRDVRLCQSEILGRCRCGCDLKRRSDVEGQKQFGERQTAIRANLEASS